MDVDAAGIAARYRELERRIRGALERSGRDPGAGAELPVAVVAVTKTHPAELVQRALDAGIRRIGENRVQEAAAKLPQLRGRFEAHLVGHLQGNKAAAAVELFDWIQSVDSLALAERLSRRCAERGRPLRALWEVNTSGEPAKFGFEAAELERQAAAMAALPALEFRGLMTVGPVPESGRDPRPCFAALRALRERLEQSLGRALPELSMGMSGDFETGVEEGATLVRVGTALFGARQG
ncbi:MAG TPA: YggS family pyridoxal phosphate-dependent enzyme [Candidatus Saccharimonadales bacterium]|nr:YggS family pyridoxal phosphate-dependent enzyme [Candidatus Saccharimonadales bacterium]